MTAESVTARTMPESWEFRVQPGPRVIMADPGASARSVRAGEVRVRFLAGGICGSDIGVLAGIQAVDQAPDAGLAPLHEIVARVVESRDDRFVAGDTVVGTGLTGLTSDLIEEADRLIPLPAGFTVTEAVAIQPISTVLRAVEALPPVAGLDVAVIGAGAIGLAFVHVLRGRGARRIVAVDPVGGRREMAQRYGADEFVAADGQAWSPDPASPRPALVIDAVGRQPDLIAAALRIVADGGFVLGFGSAADGDYPIPFAEMYHRRLTLASGRTREHWVPVLDRGADYLRAHREDFAGYVSHRFPVADAQLGYDLCSRPDDSRIKVALVAAE